jgi:hypothetical protein
MKILPLAFLIFISFAVKAQLKRVTITNAEGSRSNGLTFALGDTINTIPSQSSSSYPSGMYPEPIMSKKGANKKTYVLIANESDAKVAKFEIVIFSGNKTVSKATSSIRFSANSFTPKLLGNGSYIFSDKSPAERLKYEFSGTVKLGSVDVPISEGWFTVERIKKNVETKYDLTLNNGVKTTGLYNSGYQTEDRSTQL